MSRLGLGIAFAALWLGAVLLLRPSVELQARAGASPGGPSTPPLLTATVLDRPSARLPDRAPTRPERSTAAVPSPPEPIDVDRLDALFAALRDDEVRHNANYAYPQLRSLAEQDDPHRLEIRRRARRALGSYDIQEVELCEDLLLDLALISWDAGDREPPLPRTLDLAAENLAGVERDHYGIPNRLPWTHSMELAIAQAESMEPRLLPLLRSPSEGVRHTAAVALACGRRLAHARILVEVLQYGLRDNDRSGDALLSVFALKQLGPDAFPWLPRASVALDDQHAWLLRAARAELESPGSSRSLGPRRDLTSVAPHAPAADWRPRFRLRRD